MPAIQSYVNVISVKQAKPVVNNQMTGPELADLWDKKRTARYLHVSVSLLDQMVMKKSGPPHLKIGTLVRFIPEDVYKYAGSCRAT